MTIYLISKFHSNSIDIETKVNDFIQKWLEMNSRMTWLNFKGRGMLNYSTLQKLHDQIFDTIFMQHTHAYTHGMKNDFHNYITNHFRIQNEDKLLHQNDFIHFCLSQFAMIIQHLDLYSYFYFIIIFNGKFNLSFNLICIEAHNV